MQISPDFLARPITILSTQEPWRHSHLGQRVQNWDMSTIAKQLPTKSTSCQDILWNEDLSQTTTVKKDIDRQYNLHIVNINYHFTQENSVSWICEVATSITQHQKQDKRAMSNHSEGCRICILQTSYSGATPVKCCGFHFSILFLGVLGLYKQIN